MTIIAQDTCQRANQSGFGTASDGQVWSSALRGTLTASINSNEGQATGGGSSDTLWQLGTKTTATVDVLVRIRATAYGNDIIGPAVRIQDANNFYRPRNAFGVLAIWKMLANVPTVIVQTNRSFTDGAYYWYRYRIVGSNHYLRIWPDGTTEPTTWDLTATDSSFTSGGFGMEAWSQVSGDVMNFDHFTVDNLAVSFAPVKHTINQLLTAVRTIIARLSAARAQKSLLILTKAATVATPNTTIQSTITVTDVNSNPVSNLSACSVTITFPDGSTSTLSLSSGVTNLGSGQYQAQYATKGVGPIREVWSVTAADGVTVASYQFITETTY